MKTIDDDHSTGRYGLYGEDMNVDLTPEGKRLFRILRALILSGGLGAGLSGHSGWCVVLVSFAIVLTIPLVDR